MLAHIFESAFFLLFSLEIKPFPDDLSHFFHIRFFPYQITRNILNDIDEPLLGNPFCIRQCFVLIFGLKFNIFLFYVKLKAI